MKNLELIQKVNSFTDKKTQLQREYRYFCVELNGIELRLEPSDATVRQLLNQYYTDEEVR